MTAVQPETPHRRLRAGYGSSSARSSSIPSRLNTGPSPASTFGTSPGSPDVGIPYVLPSYVTPSRPRQSDALGTIPECVLRYPDSGEMHRAKDTLISHPLQYRPLSMVDLTASKATQVPDGMKEEYLAVVDLLGTTNVKAGKSGSPNKLVTPSPNDDVFGTPTKGAIFVQISGQQSSTTRDHQTSSGDPTSGNFPPPRNDRVQEPVNAGNAQGHFPPDACVFVGNMSKHMSDFELKKATAKVFDRFGRNYIKIFRNANHVPHAFIQFEKSKAATQAIEEGSGVIVGGRPIRTEKAKSPRTIVVSRWDKATLTGNDVRHLLRHSGPMSSITKPTPTELTMFDLPECWLVAFVYWQDFQDAQRAFQHHGVYKIELPSDPRRSLRSSKPIRRLPTSASEPDEAANAIHIEPNEHTVQSLKRELARDFIQSSVPSLDGKKTTYSAVHKNATAISSASFFEREVVWIGNVHPNITIADLYMRYRFTVGEIVMITIEASAEGHHQTFTGKNLSLLPPDGIELLTDIRAIIRFKFPGSVIQALRPFYGIYAPTGMHPVATIAPQRSFAFNSTERRLPGNYGNCLRIQAYCGMPYYDPEMQTWFTRQLPNTAFVVNDCVGWDLWGPSTRMLAAEE